MEGDPLKQCTEILPKVIVQEHVELLHGLHECSRYTDNSDVGHLAIPTVLVPFLVSVTRYPAKSNLRQKVLFWLTVRGLKAISPLWLEKQGDRTTSYMQQWETTARWIMTQRRECLFSCLS